MFTRCQDSNFCGPTIFSQPKFASEPNFLTPKIFSYSKFILGLQFYWTHNYFRPKILLDTNFFCGPKFFLSQNLFRPIIYFRPKICLGLGDFQWRQGIKLFQAEQIRLKSSFSSLSILPLDNF